MCSGKGASRWAQRSGTPGLLPCSSEAAGCHGAGQGARRRQLAAASRRSERLADGAALQQALQQALRAPHCGGHCGAGVRPLGAGVR